MVTRIALLSSDLLRCIGAYQRGYLQDMAPFATTAAATTTRRLFEEWFATYGHARLPLFLSCLPHMSDTVVLHAVATDCMHLLDTLGLDLDDFDNLVQVAAERGHLQAIVRLHEMAYESGTNDALVAAATNGHLNVVEYLADSHRTNAHQVAHAVVAAAARGNMAIVQFLAKNGSSSSNARAAFTMASANGHLPIVRWLYEHGTQDWSADAFTLAAAGGHVEVLTYLTQVKPRRGATMPAMDAAAMNGHLNVVQFLHQCRPADGCSAKALEGARLNGHTDVVAYLKLHGDHLIHETCNACGFHKPRDHKCRAIS
ncbi:hypothetical protein H257_12685 [Aphanomyces astaci]|uniref:Uncharacterized protein n=1 Tax=Aphanomyces astaci TaxID=112090 RepID=W4FXI1_APHAT|nr:hypothetical protein H257_12685 [Aphanomyces astaci]ETV72210.1 hypothetical protein H257_12685 [Aphanomyces astaci]|eukprot:XP_009838278.1 hypothetical protein H257_12685 [Aphanomyces astaci]